MNLLRRHPRLANGLIGLALVNLFVIPDWRAVAIVNGAAVVTLAAALLAIWLWPHKIWIRGSRQECRGS